MRVCARARVCVCVCMFTLMRVCVCIAAQYPCVCSRVDGGERQCSHVGRKEARGEGSAAHAPSQGQRGTATQAGPQGRGRAAHAPPPGIEGPSGWRTCLRETGRKGEAERERERDEGATVDVQWLNRDMHDQKCLEYGTC